MHTIFWLTSLMGRDHSEDIDVDGKVILEFILGNTVGGCGLDASGSGLGPVAGSSEHSNELSGPVEGGEFID